MKILKFTIILTLCFISSNIIAQLIHQYKFDGNLEDAVGDSNGVVAGGPGTPNYIMGHDSTENGAILFSTTDWCMIDVGRFSPSQEGAANQMTVTFWAYWNGSTGESQDIINKRDNYINDEMMWGINQHNSTGHVLSVHTPASMTNSNAGIPEGEWTHVAISIDLIGKARFYMNGVKFDEQDFTYGTDTEAMIHIGTSANNGVANVNDVFNGALDDVRFYNRKLSDAQISNIYNEPITTLELTSGVDSQSVYIDSAITDIVYTWGGNATDVTITDLPTGLEASKDTLAKTLTISGAPTAVDTITYTVTTVQPTAESISLSGKIIAKEAPVGLSNKSIQRIQLFPNPAGNSFQINGFEGKASISIMDIGGKLIFSKDDVLSNEVIAIDELISGMYILRIANESGITEMKLLKE